MQPQDYDKNSLEGNFVELLEELTFARSAPAPATSARSGEYLDVDLGCTIVGADCSRRGESREGRAVRLGAQDLIVVGPSPFPVGDHFSIAFVPEELVLPGGGRATVGRCVACAEDGTAPDYFRSIFRLIEGNDLRRAVLR